MGPRKVKLDTYRKRSVVWSFFTDIDEGSVQCVLCNRFLHKKEHGSTTPMLRHLRLKHPTQVYRGMERDHEAAASHDHQHMEIDDEQIISVVVSVDDDESNTRTTQNNSDPSTAVSGLCETSPRGSLAHLIHEDDLSHIPNKQSRRRSLIWRLFEHLDNLNAARCRICMKKLHKSGGISNLRRHLVKRHPKVLSELLSTNHRPAVPSQDVNAAGVSRESYIGTEPHPVKLVLDDGESHIMTTLNEPDIPAINKLPGIPQGESAEKIIEAEDSNGDGTGGTMWDSGQKWFPVEVRVEDDSSDVMTPSIEPDASHIINDNSDSLQEGLAQEAFQLEAGESSSERPQTKDRRRSVIWRHFERLESSEAAQCRICMRKLQCYDSGCTGNLHRHLSKRHPKVFSELGSNSLKQLSPDSNGHGGTTESPLIKHELSVRSSFPSAGLKISRQPEVEVRVFERELELIEALRRTQREEAQALQQQRELLERLQTVGAREAAADRETIESLRKAQQEEADELIRQKEELEKEKAELRKKWEELYQEKEEFSLLSKSKATH
ncbi:zinc finger BED domain-containing protein isoform X1 [Gambusia affinis]|uniref:zinc finger BED domain-containing protein isoform X1 n=1 Tax=Gambusia affinis TaxID=33528 RepID=UPI001CDBE158|nr:zinc finger BED domain-containing protein isoform X1 [Gambusia affinis]